MLHYVLHSIEFIRKFHEMKEAEDIINEMIGRYPGLESCKQDISEACRVIID